MRCRFKLAELAKPDTQLQKQQQTAHLKGLSRRPYTCTTRPQWILGAPPEGPLASPHYCCCITCSPRWNGSVLWPSCGLPWGPREGPQRKQGGRARRALRHR